MERKNFSVFDFVVGDFFKNKKRRYTKKSYTNKVTVTWPGHEKSRRRMSHKIGDYDLLTATFINNIKNYTA